MKKNKVRGIIVLAVVLIAFLVIAILVPFTHTATYWTGFVFGIIAIIVSAIGTAIAFKGDESAKSRFYGFPIARLAVIYLIVQVIVSFILMGLAAIAPFWIGLIVGVILLVLCIIGLVAADMTRDEVERQDIKIKTDVKAMRSLQSRANILVTNCESDTTKAAAAKLAEEFKYSDPVSNDATKQLEDQLSDLLDETEKSVSEGDYDSADILIKKVSDLLKERNRVCKLNK